MPKSKSEPGVLVLHMQSLVMLHRFWTVAVLVEDANGGYGGYGGCLRCTLLTGHVDMDWGLTRHLSLRHEIASLWVSPGSLKGRHKGRHYVSPEMF